MNCVACKTEISDKAKFCPECGKPAPKPEPKEEAVEKMPMVLTTTEAMKFLKISKWKIYDLINKNEIPYRNIGNRKRFLTNELIKWMGGVV